jgi:tetratricopeptide (TPR) repeat protein/predicted Ser/Thr protein kinase
MQTIPQAPNDTGDVGRPQGDSTDESLGRQFDAGQSPLGCDTQVRVDMVAAKLFGKSSPPTTIGGYTVLREIGAGGMGVVYVAYDERLDRRIAIKVLRGTPNNETARLRLQREAQAMARLAHPNVVAVHEVETYAGGLFLAMEFVDGQNLREWLAIERRGWREILTMFRQAGAGLAAAHEAGIVHRDFKPDNVLVGIGGRPRVADFGLAHEVIDIATDVPERGDSAEAPNPRLTRTGAIVGSPAYMAPEQFRGNPTDARSDQFAFCVTLWEALYGSRPFAGENIEALFEAVIGGRVQAPPPDAGVPAWIHRAVLRGIALEPADRHPSMQALLDVLADDPTYRRRRRWTAAGVAALLLGGAWGLMAMSDEAPRVCVGMDEKLVGVWDDDVRAELKDGFESAGAGTRFAAVEATLDDYRAAWIGMRTEACEATQRGEQSSGLLDLRMACLDERLGYLRAMVGVLAEPDDTLVVDQARALSANLPTLATCADAEALLAAEPLPEDPDDANEARRLRADMQEVFALEIAGKYEDAKTRAERIVADAEALGHEATLAWAWLRLGSVQRHLGELEQAEHNLERAYALALGLGLHEVSATASMLLIFVVGAELGRYEDGMRWGVHAEPLARADGSPEAPVGVHLNLGIVALEAGHYDDARGYFERSLKVAEQVLPEDHPDRIALLEDLGIVATRQADYELARDYGERVLEIRQRKFGDDHRDVGFALSNLGMIAALEGKHALASSHFEKALHIFEATLGPDHPQVAVGLLNLGLALQGAGDLELAREPMEQARSLFTKTLGSDHVNVAVTIYSLGTLELKVGNLDRAAELLDEARGKWEGSLPPEHPYWADLDGSMAELAIARQDKSAARMHLERALALREKVLGAEHPDTISLKERLASLDSPSEPSE